MKNNTKLLKIRNLVSPLLLIVVVLAGVQVIADIVMAIVVSFRG